MSVPGEVRGGCSVVVVVDVVWQWRMSVEVDNGPVVVVIVRKSVEVKWMVGAVVVTLMVGWAGGAGTTVLEVGSSDGPLSSDISGGVDWSVVAPTLSRLELNTSGEVRLSCVGSAAGVSGIRVSWFGWWVTLGDANTMSSDRWSTGEGLTEGISSS